MHTAHPVFTLTKFGGRALYKVCCVWRPSPNYVPQGPEQVGIEYTYGELCVYTRDSSWPPQLKTLELDWPQRDRSATSPVFLHHHPLTALSFQQGKVRQAFQKCYCFDLFRTIKIAQVRSCVTWNCRSFWVSVCMHMYVRTYVCMNACMYGWMDGCMGVYLFMWLQTTVYLVRWKTNSVQMSPRAVNECNKEWRACFRIILFCFRYWSIGRVLNNWLLVFGRCRWFLPHLQWNVARRLSYNEAFR